MIAFFMPVKRPTFEVCVKGRAGRNTNHPQISRKKVRQKVYADIQYRIGYW
jgi:hypothetical protein